MVPRGFICRCIGIQQDIEGKRIGSLCRSWCDPFQLITSTHSRQFFAAFFLFLNKILQFFAQRLVGA